MRSMKIFVFWLGIVLLTYSQAVGDVQMAYELEEPCYMSNQVDSFDVLWPGLLALTPIGGQVVAFGWAVALAVSYGRWPRPRLRIDYAKAQRVCGGAQIDENRKV